MNDRRLEQNVELDASPEQVWAAIATGPGISAWFVPSEVEQRAGGAVGQRFDGGFDVAGRVTVWEPGKRFAYGSAEPPAEGADYAFEFLVEARDGIGAEGDAGCGVRAYHYFYGEPVDADAITAAWQSWLTALFPPPPETPAP